MPLSDAWPPPSLAVDRQPRPSGRLQAGIAAWLFLAVLVTRIPSYFRSVLDRDESLYFLMAERWRQGHLPYTVIWDNKPIGIYEVFALFQYGFGDRVASIRIACVLFISLTAFAIFKICLYLPGDPQPRLRGGVFAGIAYVVCSLSNDGLSANTEIFMACFTAWAMLAALGGWGFVAGLLFGMAFMTKYVAVFEFPAVAFGLLAMAPMRRNAVTRSAVLLIAGAALPLGATILLYAGTGHFAVWWQDSILSNLRRVAVPATPAAMLYAFEIEMLRWSPLFLLGLAMLGAALWRLLAGMASRRLDWSARCNLLLALWLLGGCVGVASAKSFYDHYFLQILPVLCVTLAWTFAAVPLTRRLPAWAAACIAVAVLALPVLAAATALQQAASPILVAENGRLMLRPDTPVRVARDIRPLLGDGEIFVFDYEPIIYSLLHQAPPTRYAFPSILIKCQLEQVANVPALKETNRILAGNPEFIIRARYPDTDPAEVNLRVYAAMNRMLQARYVLWRRYDVALVYRLQQPNAPVDPNLNLLPPACPIP